MDLNEIINRLGSPIFDGVPLWVVVAVVLALILILLLRRQKS